MEQTLARIERAGFRVEKVCGSYTGDTWHPGADVWVVLASFANERGVVVAACEIKDSRAAGV